jgi:anti-anti-sigma factor
MAADRLHRSDSWWPPSAEAGSVVESCVSGSLPVLVDESDPDIVVVSVVGEIDLLTASALYEHLSGALVASPPRLVIDLTQTWLLSAAALSVLLHARRFAARHGSTLQLRAPKQPLPAHTLTITGLDRLIEIVPPNTGMRSADGRRGGGHAETPSPCPISPSDIRDDSTTSLDSLESCVESAQDEYGHLVPMQRRYAQLAVDDPQRQRLRDELIQGYLPVAEHLASRFAARGEPLEDLIQAATVGLINAVDRFEPHRRPGNDAPRVSTADTSATYHPVPAVFSRTHPRPNRQTDRLVPNARLTTDSPNTGLLTPVHDRVKTIPPPTSGHQCHDTAVRFR